MTLATHATLVLARFDSLTQNKGVLNGAVGDALFLNSAADLRAAATGLDSQAAFVCALYGMHPHLESAEQGLSHYLGQAPWLNRAVEVWGGLLEPFRHYGEANFIDRAEPGSQYHVTASPPADDTPIVVVTSAGWAPSENLDINRLREFGEGVSSVRISMTGIAGLHSQQSFFFPGRLVIDGITVTLWKDFASMRNFAYGPGTHRNMLTRQREENLSDRTSFTRFKVLKSFGSWYGANPFG